MTDPRRGDLLATARRLHPVTSLLAYLDLVIQLDYPEGQCAATVRTYRGASWRCKRRATWLVQGQVPECGQHAALSLRRELQDRLDQSEGT